MNNVKSQAELEIEALADVFNIATEGFEGFYKEANESKKGNHSTAASSGDSSTASSQALQQINHAVRRQIRIVEHATRALCVAHRATMQGKESA